MSAAARFLWIRIPSSLSRLRREAFAFEANRTRPVTNAIAIIHSSKDGIKGDRLYMRRILREVITALWCEVLFGLRQSSFCCFVWTFVKETIDSPIKAKERAPPNATLSFEYVGRLRNESGECLVVLGLRYDGISANREFW